jgi:hypothetical protein
MIKTIAIAIAFLVPVVSSDAQVAIKDRNLPVAIVLVDELPFPQARAVLIRRKEMKPQNLVLVTKATAPGDLSRAMATLAASRRKNGDLVKTDMVAPIAENRAARESKDYRQAQADLQKLRGRAPRFIDGVGSRPVLFSHLRPSAARKSKG